MARDNSTAPKTEPCSSSESVEEEEKQAGAVHDDEESSSDICRVCRTESSVDRPLYYPCLCTGSIKFVHQECLVQWLKYSRKEYCELCNHKYSFQPIYHPRMPQRLPVTDVMSGIVRGVSRAVKCWLLYTVVFISWLGVVPLTACRIYRAIFSGSIISMFLLPVELISADRILTDVIQGFFIVSIFLLTFICLFWLREQIVNGGPNELINLDLPPAEGADQQQQQAQNDEQEVNGADDNVVQQVIDAAAEQLPAAEQPAEHEEAEGNVVEHGQGPVDENNGGFGMALANMAAQQLANLADQFLNDQLDEDEEEEDEAEVEQAAAEVGVEQEQAAPAALQAPAGENNNNANNNNNNWLDWGDRGDDLTWERLLGLDGSFVFIEHIFWVISLNTFFTLIFAFAPYHVGRLGARLFKFDRYLKQVYFEGVVTALFGYVQLCAFMYLIQQLARLFKAKRLYKIFGMSYLVIKVFLLVLMEIGLFPLLCGWWLDICSLPMMAATLSGRLKGLQTSAPTSMFVHWLVGMVYVFYFASFVLVLREVVRPGLLWFLRNLNDPEFNPIQEMIQLPVLRHVRRLLASTILFSVSILLTIYLPIRLLQTAVPYVLPYNISLTAFRDTPLGELSLELLLLQVVLPVLMEQSHAKAALRFLIRYWCLTVGHWLDLVPYLLPAVEHENGTNRDNNAAGNADGGADVPPAVDDVNNNQAGGNLAAEHQALLLAREPTSFQSYRRPTLFPLRILVLLVVLAVSSLLASFVCLSVPVTMGRWCVSLATGHDKVHEIYTISTGLYVCWLALRLGILAGEWLPAGWRALAAVFWDWTVLAFKLAVAAISLLGLIPLMVGTMFQLMAICPLRVNLYQTPIIYHWQDWVLGILHCKIVCAVVSMGPDWWLKTAFERMFHDGVRNLCVKRLMVDVVAPVVSAVGLVLAVPYLLAESSRLLGATAAEVVILKRSVHPLLMLVALTAGFSYWQFNSVKRLVSKIRNDKYLIGQQLMNYERKQKLNVTKQSGRDEGPAVELV